jgi:antitoxin component YwqK of YwqJK toxin-antitoxin module
MKVYCYGYLNDDIVIIRLKINSYEDIYITEDIVKEKDATYRLKQDICAQIIKITDRYRRDYDRVKLYENTDYLNLYNYIQNEDIDIFISCRRVSYIYTQKHMTKLFVNYHINGREKFVHNLETGDFMEYNSNGYIILEGNFDDKDDGYCKIFSDSGNLLHYDNYKNGVLHGECSIWNEDSILIHVYTYEHGIKLFDKLK